MRPFVAFALLTAIAGATSASASTLKPGGNAPALDVKSWYKGTPVTSFDADKTYVVEFWATWCGPCRESIPHLTDLAKANTDVTFVGVSIWEDDNGTNVADFVKKMGDKMDYHVGYSGNKTGMAESWMQAAGQQGIPTAFVIKNKTVEWIGHPMELAEPLAQIKSGKYDLAAFQAKFAKQQAQQEAEMAVMKDIQSCVALYKAGNKAEAKTKLDGVIKAHPDASGQAELIELSWLAADDPAAWEKQADSMAASKNEGKLQQLCMFAMQDSSSKPQHTELDRKAMSLALKASNNGDLIVLYYATMVYENTKDYQLALDAAQACLKLLPTSQFKSNEQLAKFLEDKTKSLQAKIKA